VQLQRRSSHIVSYRTLHLRGFSFRYCAAVRGDCTTLASPSPTAVYCAVYSTVRYLLSGRTHHNNAPSPGLRWFKRQPVLPSSLCAWALSWKPVAWLSGQHKSRLASWARNLKLSPPILSSKLWAQELPCGGPPAQHGIRSQSTTYRAWGGRARYEEAKRRGLLAYSGTVPSEGNGINQSINRSGSYGTTYLRAAGKRSIRPSLFTLSSGYLGPHRLALHL
jgi:hypothetical protein